MTSMGVAHDQFKQLCEAIRFGLEFTPLSEREKDIVWRVLGGGKSFAEIGATYDISKERVKQIFQKALRRAQYALMVFAEGSKELNKEIERVRQENISLQLTIERLKSGVPIEDFDRSGYTPLQIRILTTPVKDLEFSIRLKNCLRTAEIFTLSELLGVTTSDLLRFRNFGKRSLMELREYMNKIGIQWQ